MYIGHTNRFSIFLQFSAAIPLAALTTLSLILLMHQLVFERIEPPIEEPLPTLPEITFEKRGPINVRITPVEKPEKAQKPPEIARTKSIVESLGEFTAPSVEPIITTKQLVLRQSTGRYPVAHLLASPQYPRRALIGNVEGWVDLRYDITELGITDNIEVLAAQPKGYFERAAINAVARWRYQPLINDNGEPAPYTGLTNRVVFKLEE